MDHLASVCEDIQRHASRLKKVAILAEYFKSLSEDDLTRAVQLLSVGPAPPNPVNPTLFEIHIKPELKIGGSVLREALRVASGWDKETLSICHATSGRHWRNDRLMMTAFRKRSR